jgi:hypothetical protein
MRGYIYCISYTSASETPQYYIGMSEELPYYILLKRNYDIHQHRYKCVFAKNVKDLAIEKAKIESLLHIRCGSEPSSELRSDGFVEIETTEAYRTNFLPSLITLEYIQEIFNLTLGDYIDTVDNDIENSMLSEYTDYVICERIEHAFYKLEKEKEILQKFKCLKDALDTINVDFAKTLKTYEALSDSTKDKVMRTIQSL